VLRAQGPATDRADKMMLYGQFVGDWEGDAVDYAPDGSRRTGKGEVHFGWVLEGRAIQDVWILPTRAERKPTDPLTGDNVYGTTIRVYDPKADVWHLTWINPVNGAEKRLVGRQVGDAIVQEGTTDDGSRLRWTFSEIQPRSMHWKGEVSSDGGQTWRLQDEVFLRRLR
jgi:hypothetical protein